MKGVVDGRGVCVGARSFADECVEQTDQRSAVSRPAVAGLRAHVVVDGRRSGTIEFADQVRPGLAAFFAELQGLGVGRTVLRSGDSVAHTLAVAQAVGIRDARGELLPGGKVAVVTQLVGEGERVLMVGDGTNDAPALSAAHVGIALAGHGGGIGGSGRRCRSR